MSAGVKDVVVEIKPRAQRIAEASAFDGAAIHYTNQYGDEYHSRFVAGQYSNGRLAIQTESVEHGEPETKLTVNFEVCDGSLDEAAGEIVVKTWGENAHGGIAAAALATGFFEDTGKRVSNGYVEASIWRVLTRDEVDRRAEALAEAREAAARAMPR